MEATPLVSYRVHKNQVTYRKLRDSFELLLFKRNKTISHSGLYGLLSLGLCCFELWHRTEVCARISDFRNRAEVCARISDLWHRAEVCDKISDFRHKADMCARISEL
jgi:hypothetical protein